MPAARAARRAGQDFVGSVIVAPNGDSSPYTTEGCASNIAVFVNGTGVDVVHELSNNYTSVTGRTNGTATLTTTNDKCILWAFSTFNSKGCCAANGVIYQ